jgi:hypothetical protein
MTSRSTLAFGVATLAGVLLATTWWFSAAAGAATNPVGVTLSGTGGCLGAGTAYAGNGSLLDAATAPGGGGAASSRPLVVARDGTVRWHGSTSTVITNHHWSVDVDGIEVKSGGSANASRSTQASGVEHVSSYLPSWLGLTGVFYVNGQISGSGGACAGAVYVQINGDPATGALLWVGVLLVLVGGVVIFYGLPTLVSAGSGSGASATPSATEPPPPTPEPEPPTSPTEPSESGGGPSDPPPDNGPSEVPDES